ncbi:MAG: PP2C family protein-serine/threonine phosphatase [Acidobacteriota bacterium]|nr:PP2C family protein-serine/threonine phosphatase [Acidobacteriota bacterium]
MKMSDANEPRSPNRAALEIENSHLRRAVQELSVLNDLARAIGGSLQPDQVMKTIINSSLKAVNAQQGMITLVDHDPAHPSETLVRANVSSSNVTVFHLTHALLGWMQLNQMPLVISNPESDARFTGVTWDSELRSLLCVPLMVKSQMKGILTVYNKKTGDSFDSGDERLLAIIASQSAQVIENARLYEEERAFARMREQVQLAVQVQEHLLPQAAPQIPGYDIAGKSIAAQEIGGDYFDFVPMPDGRSAICLGDVSGKGLPASLLMANVQATIRLLASLGISAAETMARANSLLCRSTPPEKFVTFFFSILDPVRHTMAFCNAGHNPPLLFSASGHSDLRTSGLVLGMIDGHPYKEGSVTLAPGDVVVIYSDGVTEAVNSMDEEFGEERLIEIARLHRHESAASMLSSIIAAVLQHCGTQPQYDDMTLVIVKRT